MRIPLTDRIQHMQNPTAQRLLHLMQHKQSNLCVSADVVNSQALLELADTLGPALCLLKTHIDIIEDFSPALVDKLQALATKHQFILFEDRKFADIGHTVQLQYTTGCYRIAEWAPIVNAHITPGPGIIEGLKTAGLARNNALLLIAQMSSKDNLMDKDYQQQALQWAYMHKDFVIGFIAMQALDTDFLTFTPGIHLDVSNDNLGQQYRTPQQAIAAGTDIIIVGRAITNAADPLASAQQYRRVAWDAYQAS